MSIVNRSDRPSRIWVGLGATMLLACSPEPTVDIIGAIEMSIEAVHVEEAGGGTHAIGLLDDAVIISGLVNAPGAPWVAPFGAVAQWFNLQGEPLGPAADLGFSAGYPQGWVRLKTRFTRSTGVITLRPSLVGVRDGVIVVWDQRSAPLYFEDPVSSHADYEEGIFAVLLTPDGRRGSEVVEITSPEHTAVIDDVPSEYAPMVAVDGERVAVAWLDARVDAPGVYFRLLRFIRTAELSDAE